MFNSPWYLWTMRIWNTMTVIVISIWMIEFNSLFPNYIDCGYRGYNDWRVNMVDQIDNNCPTYYDTKPSERCSCWQDPHDETCIMAMDVSKCNGAANIQKKYYDWEASDWTCSCYYTVIEPEYHYVWIFLYIGFVIFIECGKLFTILSNGCQFANIEQSSDIELKISTIQIVKQLSVTNHNIWAFWYDYYSPLGKSFLLYMYYTKIYDWDVFSFSFLLFLIETISGAIYVVYYGWIFMEDSYVIGNGDGFLVRWCLTIFVIFVKLLITALYRFCAAKQYNDEVIQELKKYGIYFKYGKNVSKNNLKPKKNSVSIIALPAQPMYVCEVQEQIEGMDNNNGNENEFELIAVEGR